MGFIEEMTSLAETTLVCRDGQSIEREMWNVESHTRPMHPNGKVRIARSFQKMSLTSSHRLSTQGPVNDQPICAPTVTLASLLTDATEVVRHTMVWECSNEFEPLHHPCMSSRPRRRHPRTDCPPIERD